MDLFIQLDVDILAFVILLAMFINTRRSMGLRNKSTDLFSRLTFLMLISTFVEIVTFALDGRPGSWMYAAGYISNTLLFALAPVTLYLWVDYIENLFVKDLVVCRYRVALRGVLVAALLLMVLANFYTGILFHLEEGNVYVRGPWFMVQVMLNVLIAGQAYLTLLLNRRRLNPVMLWSLVLFPLLPVAGVAIQTLFYGTTATLSFKTIALLLIYINVQRAMIFIDPLTGLENRRSIDLLVKAMGDNRRDVLYAGMMLDIDNLKVINDLYGHAAGDLAIKRTAELLRGCLRKSDFVARYAGDEFLVVMEVEDRMALLKAVERIQEAFEVYNETSGDSWQLEVSMGYDTFVYKTPDEVEQALKEIDLKMYEEKHRRKTEKKSNLNAVSV